MRSSLKLPANRRRKQIRRSLQEIRRSLEVIGSHGTAPIRRQVVTVGPSPMFHPKTWKTLRYGFRSATVSPTDCRQKKSGNLRPVMAPEILCSRGEIRGKRDAAISMKKRVQ